MTITPMSTAELLKLFSIEFLEAVSDPIYEEEVQPIALPIKKEIPRIKSLPTIMEKSEDDEAHVCRCASCAELASSN